MKIIFDRKPCVRRFSQDTDRFLAYCKYITLCRPGAKPNQNVTGYEEQSPCDDYMDGSMDLIVHCIGHQCSREWILNYLFMFAKIIDQNRIRKVLNNNNLITRWLFTKTNMASC